MIRVFYEGTQRLVRREGRHTLPPCTCTLDLTHLPHKCILDIDGYKRKSEGELTRLVRTKPLKS